MIVCTRCGASNEDAARSCQACGRKLQSYRLLGDGSRLKRPEELEPLGSQGFAGWHVVKKGLEAWAYALVVAAAAGWGLYSRDWRPLYAAIPVVGLLAWLRLRRDI